MLRQLAPELALVHAQTETLTQLRPGAAAHSARPLWRHPTDAVAEAYARWRAAADKLDELLQGEQDRLRMVDLWSYQSKEIDAAHLVAGEDEALETEKRVLANAEKLYAAAMGAFERFTRAALRPRPLCAPRCAMWRSWPATTPALPSAAQQLASARATVGDVGASLRDYAEGINASPERLAEIEDRLALLDRLKRKYGNRRRGHRLWRRRSPQAGRSGRPRRDSEGAARRSRQSRKGYQDSRPALERRAPSRRRQAGQAGRSADQLAGHEGQIRGRRPRSKKQNVTGPRPAGTTVEYRIATNPGEPLKPLHEIASGGEMSRVMLALKVSVEEGQASQTSKKKKTPTPRTLVFDEIDIGIGGRAAEAVGQKLKSLSRGQQVFASPTCRRSPPSPTSILSWKSATSEGRTKTQIGLLDDRARTQEVARMFCGATVTDTSLQHAAQMIAGSR